MKATNCATWDEACEKYARFTSSEKLEPFKKLNFNNPTIPEEFMRYCQLALKKGDDSGSGLKSYDGDSIFVLDHCSAVGLFWKYDVLSASADCLDAVFKNVSMNHVLHGNRGITLDNCCPLEVYVHAISHLLSLA